MSRYYPTKISENTTETEFRISALDISTLKLYLEDSLECMKCCNKCTKTKQHFTDCDTFKCIILNIKNIVAVTQSKPIQTKLEEGQVSISEFVPVAEEILRHIKDENKNEILYGLIKIQLALSKIKSDPYFDPYSESWNQCIIA